MRRLSVCIDTLLLLAGINLWLLLGLNPLDNHWLAWKLALLCAYIVLGYVVLKGQHTALARLGLLTAALTCVATMASLAIWHAV